MALSPRARAALQALFVTFLWSTSWIIIKFGLRDMPAITFAGLRYTLAFLCLLPFALRSQHLEALRRLSSRHWAGLIGLGILFYTFTQGAQFVGLKLLPAVTVNLLLNFTTLIVAWLGAALLKERPAILQWGGVLLSLVGALIYFYPVVLSSSEFAGVAVVLGGVLANAAAAILGRQVNRDSELHPVVVTTVTMGVGSILLLAIGIAFQGLPPLTPINWLSIFWLAVVNTAFAFTLWNHTLQTLPAVESSIINSMMLVQIPLLAWIFLGESLTAQEIVGMVLAGLGVLIVQLRRG